MEIFGKKWEIKKNPKRIIFFIILILIGYWYYQDSVEQQNRAIDEYNLWQVEKVSLVLDNLTKDSKEFQTLGKFNQIYWVNLKPVDNCYYISTNNGKEKYIFAFQLKSRFYKKEYLRDYYVYPAYDLPYDIICAGYCYDRNMELFLRTISHPCEN